MNRRDGLLLAAILVVAAALRLWGIGWGLPATYHPDEHQYVDSAVAMLGGDLNPGRFNNPSLLKYLNLAWIALLFAAGRIAGAWADVSAFQAAFAADPSLVYTLARTFFALLGVATVALTGHVARLAFDMRTGLVASALLGGAFLHARDSHYAVSDVPAALWVVLASWLALQLLEHGRARDLLLGGVLVGLASATKYSAAIVVLPLGLAWLLHGEASPTARLRRAVAPAVAGAGVAAALAFLAAVPFALLDRPAFWEDVTTLAARGREGFKGLAIDPSPGWIFYGKSLAWGLGWPLLALAIVALLVALVSRRREMWVLACLPLVLWLWLGSQLLMFARFMIPALPPLLMLAAWALCRASQAVTARLGREEATGILAALLTALVLTPSLAAALRSDQLLGRTDTRTLAKAWIAAEVAEGTRILLQSSGPELGGDRVERVGTLDLPEQPIEAWRDEGWEILVTSSFATDRRLLDADRDAHHRDYYAALADGLPVLAEFSPRQQGDRPSFVFAQVYGPATELWSIDRPGPLVRIYDLREPSP